MKKIAENLGLKHRTSTDGRLVVSGTVGELKRFYAVLGCDIVPRGENAWDCFFQSGNLAGCILSNNDRTFSYSFTSLG